MEGEKKEGTGLGLAIARKSVELLGGTISAASEVGLGRPLRCGFATTNHSSAFQVTDHDLCSGWGRMVGGHDFFFPGSWEISRILLR